MNVLWYLSRGSGLTAAVLLAAVLGLGVARSERWQHRAWPWLLTTHLHRRLSMLMVGVVALHVVAVILDGYVPVSWWDAIVPFVSDYRRIWSGLGTVSLDVLLLVVLTSTLMRVLGYPVWRAVHWSSYALGALVLLHGLGDGTDVHSAWALVLLLVLAVCCAASPLSRLVGRTVGDSAGELRWRVAAGAVSMGAFLAIGGFALAGPLQPGWARSAGTPARLLGASTLPASDDGRGLPSGIDDRINGARATAADGSVSVLLTDERDPSIVVSATSAPTSGYALVTIARHGLPLCYATPRVLDAITFTCSGAPVTVTLTSDASGVAGALMTGRPTH